MGNKPQDLQKSSLPISDLVMLIFYSLITPILLLIALIVISSYYSKDYDFFFGFSNSD